MSKTSKAHDTLAVIQISDPHMGSNLEQEVLYDIQGTEGHDPRLARKLQAHVRQLAEKVNLRPEDLYWIVGGDLTRVGNKAELDVLRSYMQDVPVLDPFGVAIRETLGVPRERYVDVPGNHDHFAGWEPSGLLKAITSPPPAWNPSIFPGWFEPTVWNNSSAVWKSQQGSIELELFGVDSNSGWKFEPANRFARGKISTKEYHELEQGLRASHSHRVEDGVTRIRAIVCHHAFSMLPQHGKWKAFPLNGHCAYRLRQLAARYRVPVILTGHTHRFSFRKTHVPMVRYQETRARRCAVYEIRCPSTLQAAVGDRVRHETRVKRVIGDNRPLPITHGLWVHELSRVSANAAVVWKPSLHLFAGGRLYSEDFSGREQLELPR